MVDSTGPTDPEAVSDDQSEAPPTHRQPRQGLGVGNAPLSDPYQDPDTDSDRSAAADRPAPRHRGEQAADEKRSVRHFNEAAPREGPAWADRPEGRESPHPDQDVPVEEIRPEDLPEVGEPYAQPGAPFDVQGPDRP